MSMIRSAILILLLAAMVVAFGICPTFAADPTKTPVTPGELLIRKPDGKPAGACPLKHTEVDAQISGFIARVSVVQHFTNPTAEKIEAIYTFPLPEDSAVDHMEMKVGERVIIGDIHRREEAREIYEEARAAGNVASLLDQERANIFTQSVANIEPGQEVTITISYTQMLKYEAGIFKFFFPTVVGPRYMPGAPTGKTGTGRLPDTTSVPDASKISPPITPEGTRAGHDISIKATINAIVPIVWSRCQTHDVEFKYPDRETAVVTLKEKDTIPNKDFVLEYQMATSQIQSGVITNAPVRGQGGYFSLVMLPPTIPLRKNITPKEMIFVIDTSGSQMGLPLQKSKETMLYCIQNVNPGDTFNMISFSDGVHQLFPTPQPYNKANQAAAEKFLKDCESGGGTEMLPAVKAALEPAADPNRLRIVVFFTDGYIGNDMQIIDEVQKNAGAARVFPFGIGNSVNRFLMEEMAKAGRGASDIVLLNSDSQEIAGTFYKRIRNPLLTDISIDWQGLPVAVSEQYPNQIPDLFSAQPLVIKGRFTGPASGQVTVHGKVNGKPWSQVIDVDFPEVQTDNDSLQSIWARAKVDDLMSKDWMGAQTGKPIPEIKEQIVRVALDYSLMTQYTSFVAVERTVVTSGGEPKTIAVPVEMPEGVSYEGVGADKDERAMGQVSLGYGYATGSITTGRSAKYMVTASAGPAAARARASANGPAATANGTAVTPPVAPPAPATPAPPPPTQPVPTVVTADAPLDRLDNGADAAKREEGKKILAKDDEDGVKKLDTILQRLDKVLVQLIKDFNANESGSYAVPGRLAVKDGCVEVLIWAKGAKPEQIAQLEKLGLKGQSWVTKDKVLIGWVPIKSLTMIARQDFVKRVAPPTYLGSDKPK